MKALSPHQTDKHASWAFAEARPIEDELMLAARERSEELGIEPVSEGTAAVLQLLAATKRPATMVELGTGVGVSGLALLRGAPKGSVLTTLDPDAEAQRMARESFAAAGFPTSATRLISGRGRTVLPRMSTAAYDLVFIDADPVALEFHLDQAERLLRPTGLLIINNALDHDRVPRPAVREPSTTAYRAAEKRLREETSSWSTSVVLPTGTGLLLATKS